MRSRVLILCAWVTRLITNHAPIGKYRKRFFPNKLSSCHVAKPLSNQETAFSITAKDTNSHGTPNKTPSKTFLYSLISTQVCSASKKALHNSIYTLSILYSTPSFFSLFLPLLLSFFELKYLAVTTMAYHRVPCNKLLIF